MCSSDLAQASVAAKSFTKAQVKRHNTPGNCWAIVNGSVYNFTAWISRHPGGGSAITGYSARAYSAANGGTLAGSCTTSSTACSITGLVNGTTYYIAVLATNAVGTGSASTPRGMCTAEWCGGRC